MPEAEAMTVAAPVAEATGARARASMPGGELLLGSVDPMGLFGSFSKLGWRLDHLLVEGARLGAELARIAVGRSGVAPERGDLRFVDAAWRDHPLYKRLGQSYLAWAAAVDRLVERANLPWAEADRVRFVTNILTSALAPTNTLPGNPAALKRAYETAGMSLVRGARNYLQDLRRNRGMPSTVDRRPFRVGETIATTPGAVVHREDAFELLQFAPQTNAVRARPLIFVPPQINKYYFIDLRPGRSLVEYCVSRGFQVFVISWRNPRPVHRGWDLDTYARAMVSAIDVAGEVTGSEDVSVFGLCAGGITTAATLGHLAAAEDARVRNVTFAVTILDFAERNVVGMFRSDRTTAFAKRQSARRGVIDGGSMATMFTWLRPNDLVWNYWVNNYLLGNDPPAFDILAWNADSTRLPAGLHADFMDVGARNAMRNGGSLTVLGTPIDLSQVKADTFVVGGLTDHITPWKACYRTSQLFGGPSEFILTASGHIQSIVNPPGNLKARYWVGGGAGPDPEAWRSEAQERKDSWWGYWAEWMSARSGPERLAPAELGSRRHPVLEASPGRYVFER